MAKKQTTSGPQKPSAAEPKFKDRIKELRRVPASTLMANPKNWKHHPESQRGALGEVLQTVGMADALLAREVDGELLLIDGHLRADMMGEEEVPVLILDVTDAEADKLLATIDPLASMAAADQDLLASLMDSIDVADGALIQHLSKLAYGAETPPDETTDVEEGEEAEYPISPVFDERYNYAVIFATNETDWAWLQTMLEMKNEQSYKSTTVGVGRVVTVGRLRELWNKSRS